MYAYARPEPEDGKRLAMEPPGSSAGRCVWPAGTRFCSSWERRWSWELEDAHWRHDTHWNIAGHRWAAEALLEWLKDNEDVCDGARP